MPTIKTYCAWCGEFIGLINCHASRTQEISHGICEDCFKKSLVEIEQMEKDKTILPGGQGKEK